jgi:hypothetical protein
MDGMVSAGKNRGFDLDRLVHLAQRRTRIGLVMRHRITETRMAKSLIIGTTFDEALFVEKTEIVFVQISPQHNATIRAARVLPADLINSLDRSDPLRINTSTPAEARMLFSEMGMPV